MKERRIGSDISERECDVGDGPNEHTTQNRYGQRLS